MGLLRIATVIGVGVALLPTEPEKQAQLYQRAADTTTWVVTFCDRNAKTCDQGANLWRQFIAKAEFGAKLAYDMVRDGQQPRLEQPEAPVAPAQLKRHNGTLKPEDLRPAWRGEKSKGI